MKVSFIVPMYDVAPYIEHCARSLFSQTLESCEFIFVDDCSTDGSSELLIGLITDEFSHLQSRITMVRHASNLGVSETRNTALTIAKGEFVIFVDGDDWVAPDMAEDLVIEQIVDGADIVFSSYYTSSNGSMNICRSPIFGKLGTLQLLVSQSFAVNNRIWGLLIRRSLIANNELKFDVRLTMGEDFLFLTQLLYHAKRLSYTSEPLYFYRMDNCGSVMQNISRTRQISYMRAAASVIEFLQSHEEAKMYRRALRLLRLNLKRWLINRSNKRNYPLALILRAYALILNFIWWVRWQLNVVI